MPAYLAITLFLLPIVLIVVLFATLQHWTASKQQQLSAEEFRRWFQRTYLGMEADSIAQAGPEGRPARTRTASGVRNQDKPAS